MATVLATVAEIVPTAGGVESLETTSPTRRESHVRRVSAAVVLGERHLVVAGAAPGSRQNRLRCPRRCCRRWCPRRCCHRSALPQTMLSSPRVPQTMLSQSAPPQSLPQTMLSSLRAVAPDDVVIAAVAPDDVVVAAGCPRRCCRRRRCPRRCCRRRALPQTMLSPSSCCPRRCCRTRRRNWCPRRCCRTFVAPDDVLAAGRVIRGSPQTMLRRPTRCRAGVSTPPRDADGCPRRCAAPAFMFG